MTENNNQCGKMKTTVCHHGIQKMKQLQRIETSISFGINEQEQPLGQIALTGKNKNLKKHFERNFTSFFSLKLLMAQKSLAAR